MAVRSVAVLLGTILACVAAQAAPALAAHVGCGDIVTQDTVLDSDLVNCPEHGLVIGADNVDLNLNGHTIDGRDTPSFEGPRFGIDNRRGFHDATVHSGTIRQFHHGVQIGGSTSAPDGNVLRDLIVTSDPPDGILFGVVVDHSTGLRIERNTITGGGGSVTLTDSDGGVIAGNRMSSTHPGGGGIDSPGFSSGTSGCDDNLITSNLVESGGIAIRNGSRNVITRNTIVGGGVPAIVLHGDDNELSRTVIARRNGSGMESRGDRNRIERNTLSTGSPNTGMRIFGSDLLVERNTVLDSGDYGLVVGGDRNRIVKNTAYGNGRSGIALARLPGGSSDTLLLHNEAARNGDDGIEVEQPGPVLRHNTVNDNGDLGIQAVPGVIDGGGNKASGNGNPLQCTNVFCR